MDMRSCTLCPRMCRVDRTAGEKGFCGMGVAVQGARAALHMWEEPCISEKRVLELYFFPLYAEMCVLYQESGDRGRKVWKRDFFPEADGDFSGIAGEGSGKYQSGYGGTFCRSGEGSTFEGKGAGTCDSGNLQFGRV